MLGSGGAGQGALWLGSLRIPGFSWPAKRLAPRWLGPGSPESVPAWLARERPASPAVPRSPARPPSQTPPGGASRLFRLFRLPARCVTGQTRAGWRVGSSPTYWRHSSGVRLRVRRRQASAIRSAGFRYQSRFMESKLAVARHLSSGLRLMAITGMAACGRARGRRRLPTAGRYGPRSPSPGRPRPYSLVYSLRILA